MRRTKKGGENEKSVGLRGERSTKRIAGSNGRYGHDDEKSSATRTERGKEKEHPREGRKGRRRVERKPLVVPSVA